MKKRGIVYIIVFILLAIAAFWAFYTPDDLSHLKKTEEVTADPEVVALVEPVVAAIDKRNRRELAKLMNGNDAIMAEKMITNLMSCGQPLGPVKVIRSTRLVLSHRADNITIHLFSEPRRKSYGMTMQKNKNGKYEVLAIGTSSVKP